MPKNFCVRVKEDSIVCLSAKIDEKDTSNHQSHKSDWYFRPKDSGSALWSSWPDHKMEPSLGSFFFFFPSFSVFLFYQSSSPSSSSFSYFSFLLLYLLLLQQTLFFFSLASFSLFYFPFCAEKMMWVKEHRRSIVPLVVMLCEGT